jgi:hypothetical protein
MSLASAFAPYLATQSGSTIGQDLFIGQAPSSNKVPDAVWSVTSSGGSKAITLQSGESVKSYLLEIRYRNRDYETVYDKLHALEEALNAGDCTQLSGFETLSIEATTFPVDEDLDSEDRKLGLLVATVLTYKDNS